MKHSSIEWTDHTFNPWEGCTKVSPGCANCYAEARNRRFAGGANWGPGALRRRTSAANWKQPIVWDRAARAAELAAAQTQAREAMEALDDIARQALEDEVPEENWEDGEFEFAYVKCVKRARAAIDAARREGGAR